jgi:pimeloyl-ACP methyl ester carboxylesterase
VARASAFRSAAARDAYCALYDQAIAQSSVPVKEHDVPTSFGTTHVLEAGDPDRPPLIALHAKSCSSTMWLPLLPALVATHHVRLIDAVGDLNKSVATRVLSSPSRVVGWLDEVVAALGVTQAALVAASIGAWMATVYANARPARVDRLALVCPAGIVSRQHPLWLLSAMTKVAWRPTPEKITPFYDSMAMPESRARLHEPPWKLLAEQFTMGVPVFRTCLDEAKPVLCKTGSLAASRFPVLVVIGEDESLHDAARMAARFRERLPTARVELVPRANHLVFIDQQEQVCSLLAAFLAAGPGDV